MPLRKELTRELGFIPAVLRDGSDRCHYRNQTVTREGGTSGELTSLRVKHQVISNICE